MQLIKAQSKARHRPSPPKTPPHHAPSRPITALPALLSHATRHAQGAGAGAGAEAVLLGPPQGVFAAAAAAIPWTMTAVSVAPGTCII